ncbi:MAG: hypothetical protein EZS28_056669 [Streblomastix strix]|uniref:Uncharacterized protein n=1 Tax=Streblomastix strix TaxID=222440 RepID=A0A5J4PGE2_9EUKA|nr:MAG: hypothetical protein EZS28_056669 [Streblomastix strix]
MQFPFTCSPAIPIEHHSSTFVFATNRLYPDLSALFELNFIPLKFNLFEVVSQFLLPVTKIPPPYLVRQLQIVSAFASHYYIKPTIIFNSYFS